MRGGKINRVAVLRDLQEIEEADYRRLRALSAGGAQQEYRVRSRFARLAHSSAYANHGSCVASRHPLARHLVLGTTRPMASPTLPLSHGC